MLESLNLHGPHGFFLFECLGRKVLLPGITFLILLSDNFVIEWLHIVNFLHSTMMFFVFLLQRGRCSNLYDVNYRNNLEQPRVAYFQISGL